VVHWRGPEPARPHHWRRLPSRWRVLIASRRRSRFNSGRNARFALVSRLQSLMQELRCSTLSRARLASRKEQHALRTHPAARAAAQAKDRGGLKSGGGVDEITLPGIGKPWLLGVSGNSTPPATISIAAVQAAQHPLLQAPLPPWPQRSQQWPRVAAPIRAADTAFTVL
jgi:hypothetical protein